MTSKTPSNYIFTHSKGKFNFKNPELYFKDLPHSTFAKEIAYALSNICRYGGHCDRFYSVLHHTLLGYQTLVDMRVPITARIKEDLKVTTEQSERVFHYAVVLWLLHDASEAYLCDIPSPLKALLPEYSSLEELVESAINDTYFSTRAGSTCCSDDLHYAKNLAHIMDMAMLCAEKKLLVSDLEDWHRLGDFLKEDFNRSLANQAHYNLKWWIASKEASIYYTALGGRFKSDDETGNRDTLSHLLNLLNYPRDLSRSLPTLL